MLPLRCSVRPHMSAQFYACWRSTRFVEICSPTRLMTPLKGMDCEFFGKHFAWSFLGGSTAGVQFKTQKSSSSRKLCRPCAFLVPCSQIASHAFTFATIAVLPFYTLMVLAPNAQLTRKSIDSSIPYIILGVLYVYLLYCSWTPDTIRFLFASKYWLPELPGIAKMFSSEMTLASAWVHLLVVDLFAARQIFHDGLKHSTETRHSVSLCLLFCPIGILAHAITKALTSLKDHKKKIRRNGGLNDRKEAI